MIRGLFVGLRLTEIDKFYLRFEVLMDMNPLENL